MALRTPEVPQPTHGGVYELVDGELRVLEGGPPAQQATPAPAAPTPSPSPSPSPAPSPAPRANRETTGEGA
jgi:hypothetical protein